MNHQELQSVLEKIGERVPASSQITLIGGSALILLGSTRLTLDIDFIGDDIQPNELHQQILRIAKELKIHIDPVPLARFVPLPEGNEKRGIPIGNYGNLAVSVADPYSIALSKVDRGLETDIDDLTFLIESKHIELNELEYIVQQAVSKAGKFDLHPEILAHLEDLKSRMKR
jgi:hypothetical protein